MPSLEGSLHRFLAVAGVRTAAVIEIGTGMIAASAGEPGADLPATAACVADEVRAVRDALGGGRPLDGLIELTTVTATCLHVSRILRDRPSQGLLLFVDLDRSRTNQGLAALRISQLSPAVLA
jgi:hypothetical protein